MAGSSRTLRKGARSSPFFWPHSLLLKNLRGRTLVLDGPSGKWGQLSCRTSLGLLVSDGFLTVGWKVPGFLL